MEALLLLRENPQQQWDVAAVAKRLYIDDEQASKVLARLREALLQTDGRFLVRNCRS